MNKKQKSIISIFSIFFLTSVYAILRYNIFKGVPWADLPIYTLNKSIALTSIILILSTVFNSHKNNYIQVNLSIFVNIFIFSHVIFSLTLLGPQYYDKFYSFDKLNITGSLSLLFGILAFIGFMTSGILKIFQKLKLIEEQELKELILKNINLFFMTGHVLIMGFKGWFAPEKWPGYLLPISLISFIVLFFTLLKNTVLIIKLRAINCKIA